MGRALMEAAERFEDDDTLAVMTISGAGGCFCAGFDEDVDPGVVESVAALSKPTVAVLGGDVFDEGLELALACDLRLAAPGIRLALGNARRATMPRFGATQRLARLVGIGWALRMLLASETLDARSALRIGLITYLAASRRALGPDTVRMANRLKAHGPLALRLAKEAVLAGYDMTLAQGIRLEEDLYALLQTTRDRAEGVRAFLEKRKPLFKGN